MTDFLEASPYESDEGHLIGKTPSRFSKPELRELGHPESPIKAIRAKCLDCAGSEAEVRKCVCSDCPLWPMRMGRNPFHARAA